MNHENKPISMRNDGLSGAVFRVFDQLIAVYRNAKALLAAAREISHAVNRQPISHAALNPIVDRVYRKHGILPGPSSPLPLLPRSPTSSLPAQNGRDPLFGAMTARMTQ